MLKTKQLILSCLILALGLAVGFILSQVLKAQNYPVAAPWEPGDRKTLSAEMLSELRTTVKVQIEQKTGEPVNGLEPQVLLAHFSNLVATDFDGVEAVVGQYLVVDNIIQYNSTEVADAAADDISEAGFKTLFKNFYTRTGLSLSTPRIEVMKVLQKPASSTSSGRDVEDDSTFCPMDAMQCPDGSFVGRSGLNCTFECKDVTPPANQVLCTAEQRKADACIEILAPVCAQMQVECVTSPCDPVPQTFPNSCFACAEDRVVSYIDGSCQEAELTAE